MRSAACGRRWARRRTPTTSTRMSTSRTSAARSWSRRCSTPTSASTCGAPSELFRDLPRRRRPAGRDELPAPLADLLAGCAAETARFFFRLCARSLDYCPPVDMTFGDFLRALITVAKDLDPADS